MTTPATLPARVAPCRRDSALDFTKGLLVVGMILYHVAVFFIADPSTRSQITGPALDFVSGSWVFISGLIVALHYRQGFQTSRLAIANRLWLRGVKILLIFIVLNLFIAWLGLGDRPRIYDNAKIVEIFTRGNGALTSFEILVGIGYVLFLSPVFLFLRLSGLLLAAGILVGASIAVTLGHKLPPNLWIVLCGLGGMVAAAVVSRLPLDRLSCSESRRIALAVVLLAVATLYFLLRILGGFNKGDILVYLVGVSSILATTYLSHEWLGRLDSLDWLFRFLGRHSLLAYIGQMALIWGWHGLAMRFSIRLPYLANVALITLGIVLALLATDVARKRYHAIDKAYRAVFA
jgi:hypothetical protein